MEYAPLGSLRDYLRFRRQRVRQLQGVPRPQPAQWQRGTGDGGADGSEALGSGATATGAAGVAALGTPGQGAEGPAAATDGGDNGWDMPAVLHLLLQVRGAHKTEWESGGPYMVEIVACMHGFHPVAQLTAEVLSSNPCRTWVLEVGSSRVEWRLGALGVEDWNSSEAFRVRPGDQD